MPNLFATTSPEVVTAAGLPVLLTLEAAEIGDEEFAALYMSVDNFTVDCLFVVNGVTFKAVAGPVFGYLEFEAGTADPTTFTRAFEDSPLFADYIFFDETTIQARRSGPAWNITATVSDPIATPIVVDAAPQYVSQNPEKRAWGCYAELYVYPDAADRDYPTAPVTTFRRSLAASIELPYSAGNAYPFDLQAWLKDAVESAGRAVAYFVDYGEVYAAPTQPYRRKYRVGSFPEAGGVAWAFDAALPVLPYADPREPQFLTPYAGVRPARIVDEALWIACSAICDTSGFQIGRVKQLVNGTDEIAGELGYSVPAGGVIDITDIAVTPVDDTLEGVLLRRRDAVDEGTSEAYLIRVSSTPLPHWLRFRNRLGGLEQWGFATLEGSQKRALATFQPADGTTQTLRADLSQTLRLTSGMLTKDAFEFLCAELGASPEVEYFTSSASVLAVNIIDFDPKSDVLTDEYSIALTIEARAPFIPLSR